MQEAKEILDLDRFDAYLDPPVLLNNISELAKYLESQKTPYPVEHIRPTMDSILDTSEIMTTKNEELKLQIANAFIHAYRLSIPEQPIEKRTERKIYRLFIVLNSVFGHYENSDEQEQKHIISLIQISNQIGLYGLAIGCGLDEEIYNTFIKLNIPEGMEILIKFINESEKIPPAIMQSICEALTKDKLQNPNIKQLLVNLSEMKQTEFIQTIRSNIQGLSSVEIIKVFKQASEILELPPQHLYQLVQIDIENEDEPTREAAVELLTQAFLNIDFNPQDEGYINPLITRSIDTSYKIRVLCVKFAFQELLKIKELEQNKERLSSIERDAFESASKSITTHVWHIASERIIDPSNEVRLALMKGIYHLDAHDIELDQKTLSIRLKDKSDEVRIVALKILLKLYDAKPQTLDWLIEQIIELYPISKDVALYGFSILMSHHSLIEVAENLTNRKPLLDILNDTHQLRLHIPQLKNPDSPISKRIVAKHVDIKRLTQLLKKAPKSFFENALDYKKRKKLNKTLEQKVGSDARLLLGLYQPSPLEVESLLSCKRLDVVKDLTSIFANELENEIPRLLERLNKTDLTILAALKHNNFDDDQRHAILQALLPICTGTTKKRDLALKAFAHIYRKDDSNDELLSSIKFTKSTLFTKIQFYGMFIDTKVYTEALYDEIEDNLEDFDRTTIKYALKIIMNEGSERTIQILTNCLETYPDLAFRYYLLSANSCYGYITPEIFRQFSSVMQNESFDIRQNAIQFLTKALSLPTTPVQFLALYALSATDPSPQNNSDAKRYLENAISFRTELIKKSHEYNEQIMPETALPYLINILAHHKDFDDDLPELATFTMYLKFFITPLCLITKHYSYIDDLFTQYSMMEDVDEDFTDNMIKLCNLGNIIVKELKQGKMMDEDLIHIDFQYSSRYFKPSDDKERLKQIMKQSGFESMRSPNRPRNVLRAGMETKSSSKFKLVDSDDDDEIVSPKRKGKTTPKKKEQTPPATPQPKKKGASSENNIKSSPTTPKRNRNPEKNEKSTPTTPKRTQKTEKSTPTTPNRTQKSSRKQTDKNIKSSPSTPKRTNKNEKSSPTTPRRKSPARTKL